MAKPTKMKVLQGTTRKDRDRVSLPSDSNPIPSRKLSSDEQDVFDKICKHLRTFGVLHDVDASMITDYAWMQVKKIELQKEATTAEDIVQTFDSGASNISGHFSAITKLSDQQLKLSALMGLSPLHREKINAFSTPIEQESKLDSLMRRKQAGE